MHAAPPPFDRAVWSLEMVLAWIATGDRSAVDSAARHVERGGRASSTGFLLAIRAGLAETTAKKPKSAFRKKPLLYSSTPKDRRMPAENRGDRFPAACRRCASKPATKSELGRAPFGTTETSRGSPWNSAGGW
jgi:hypothetical protein